MKWRRRGIDRLTLASIGMAGVAMVMVVGLLQSDMAMRYTHCTVHVKAAKTLISGLKKPASRRLECHYLDEEVVIALKDDEVLPHTPEKVLKNKNALACTFDVARNPFHLIHEHIIHESISCSEFSDTG